LTVRALGFDTVAYRSAEAFIVGHSVQRFDRILIDQNLPGLAGFHLSHCRNVCAQGGWAPR
jgi:FixJ family two-component response regulator